MEGQQAPNPIGPVTAKEVSQTLRDADDPLSFIQENLKSTPFAPPVSKEQIVQPAVTPVVVARDGTVVPPAPVVPPAEALPVETAVETPSASEELPLTLETPETKTKEESVKDLRKKANEQKLALEEKEALIGTLQTDLEKYKSGEALPEVIQAKEARIAELEEYEKLHAVKLSPEFHKKYVEPLGELRDKATQIATDYNVDASVLNKALQIDNKKDLNQFLRAHFDDVGALEVREVLLEIKDLNAQAVAAEQAPAQTLENLRQEFQKKEARRETDRISSISGNSRSGWIGALTELRDAGDFPELTLKENDEEHNNIAKPILMAAAEEYGKFVRLLTAEGAKNLPPEAAKILAKRFLLAQMASVVSASRAHHYERAEDVIRDSQRRSSYVRPPIGGVANGGAAPSSRPTTMNDAAEQLLQKVGLPTK